MSGKRDRPNDMQLDEKTLEYKKNPQHSKDEDVQSPEKIAQRTIYKIKPSAGEHREASESKPKFTLVDNSESKVAETTEDDAKPKEQQNKESKHNQQQPQKIEASNGQTEGEEKKANIFNLPPNGQFLNQGVGLFTKNTGTGDISVKTSSIFSTTINNPFGKNDSAAAKMVNVFSGDGKPTSSIFGTGQSIFNFSNNGVPPIKKQVPIFLTSKAEDDDENGDSAELEKDQNQQIDRTKSTGKFEYKTQCETLFQQKALKVKKHNGEMVQNIEVIVQQDTSKGISWLTIRLAATKNAILTGYIVKGKSGVKRIGNKDQNVTLSVLMKKQQAHESHILKIQFQKGEEGRNFLSTVEKLVK